MLCCVIEESASECGFAQVSSSIQQQHSNIIAVVEEVVTGVVVDGWERKMSVQSRAMMTWNRRW